MSMTPGPASAAPWPALSLCVTAWSQVSAAGVGREALLRSLRQRRGGLVANDLTREPLATWIGRVPDLEAADNPVPAALSDLDSRNNRLAWLGLHTDGFMERACAAIRRYGAERVALVVGTSTSSIGATEEAYRSLLPDGGFPARLSAPALHMPHALGGFVQRALGLRGPCVTVATACSSSANAFAHAERLMRLGLCDAAVVGGVDSLCDSVLFGFNSLGLVSAVPCRPFDIARDGISLGEAAGFALLERDGDGPWLLGHGQSSDAHHMSAPHPQGEGARRAIASALAGGAVAAGQIDYINLHGTASRKNDEVEAAVVAELFPLTTCASSTKGWTGHTLGAAGMLEAVITCLALEHGLAPGTLNCDTPEAPGILLQNVERPLRFALSHSFGFGGSNCVLLFGRERP